MLFKSYVPSTPETKHLVRLYGCLKRTTGKERPSKADYYLYAVRKAGLYFRFTMAQCLEEMGKTNMAQEQYEYINERLTTLDFPTWEEVKAATNRETPQPNQNVVYIILFSNGGLKCGQTTNFVQRCYSITREKGKIASAIYLPLENKKQALAAENALQTVFGRSKGMKKILGKMDYFDCDPEYAEKFFSNNKRKIYDSIMEAIEGV